ncbi:MAG: class I tRNA ligase family protein [Patescibacteria group bacterium]
MSHQDELSDTAKIEEEIKEFWHKHKIFERSVERPAEEDFVFYDGPPFASGQPHFGHLLATTLKDLIPRYQTMRGKKVVRRWGWDCHGLPVENLIEKELGLKVKTDIENYGIGRFNQKAKESVLRFTKDWRQVVERMGRFVDLDNDYRTMDTEYTETIWWIFKTLYDKGLIYEGFKSMHICPRCETTLSNFEVNQGYKDITDLTVTVKLKLKEKFEASLLIWTTTPWTLPGNVAAAVSKDLEYSLVAINDEKFILAKEKLDEVLADYDYIIERTFSGQELIGLSYEPPFPYFQDQSLVNFKKEPIDKETAWRVYQANYVNLDKGTGVVHLAPAFGEEDMELAKEENLPFIQHVTTGGLFTAEVTDLAGMPVKTKDDYLSADIAIIKLLAEKNLLFSKEKITHSYPLCWRCDTPLLNYAANSWFVKVTALRDRLVEVNQEIEWVPEHLRDGRFGKWLEGVKDWAISRSRFWGAPLPVWSCDQCGQKEFFGSYEDLAVNIGKTNNTYIMMRHGQADSNVEDILDDQVDSDNNLTTKGKQQVEKTAQVLMEEGIDLIITSPLPRTKQTAKMVASALGLSEELVLEDNDLREIGFGEINGQSVAEYSDLFNSITQRFYQSPSGVETALATQERMLSVVARLEKKYKNKKILIVSHDSPLWLLEAGLRGWSPTAAARRKAELTGPWMENAQHKVLTIPKRSRNENFEVDYHRPYVDAITWPCACGGHFRRVEEVFDCWFESGAMPYAQEHYPFEDNPNFDPTTGRGFPADFIAEGIDQTRGWFYSLLVLAVGLFDQTAYKQVLTNGIILAEDGRKMSKRLQNYPDVFYTLNRYGADAVRFYMAGTQAAKGEDCAFSEKALSEIHRQVIMRFKNVMSFYNMYAGDTKRPESVPVKIDSVLDQWILTRLTQTEKEVAAALDKSLLDKATKSLYDFIDDLSNWYIRRSRDRFRQMNSEESQAVMVTGYVLFQLTKICAPVIPFVTEEIYQKLRLSTDPDSVHLDRWPTDLKTFDLNIIFKMNEVRKLVAAGLEARATAGVKVRQPLAGAKIFTSILSPTDSDLLEQLQAELNLKKISIEPEKQDQVIILDFNLTSELMAEGEARELIRRLQAERKKIGLQPEDRVVVKLYISEEGRLALEPFLPEITDQAGIADLSLINQSETDSGFGKYGLSFEIKVL